MALFRDTYENIFAFIYSEIRVLEKKLRKIPVTFK